MNRKMNCHRHAPDQQVKWYRKSGLGRNAGTHVPHVWRKAGLECSTEMDTAMGRWCGIKTCTYKFEGPFAMGFLKSKRGAPAGAYFIRQQCRRHTSFCISKRIYPLVDDTIAIEINPTDVKWKPPTSGGTGGQNVNKVETKGAVNTYSHRYYCGGCAGKDRNQLGNRELAMQMLKSRLYELELQNAGMRSMTEANSKRKN